jgi:hypothetical protein
MQVLIRSGLTVRQLSQRCVASRAMSSAADNCALIYTRERLRADVDGPLSSGDSSSTRHWLFFCHHPGCTQYSPSAMHLHPNNQKIFRFVR